MYICGVVAFVSPIPWTHLDEPFHLSKLHRAAVPVERITENWKFLISIKKYLISVAFSMWRFSVKLFTALFNSISSCFFTDGGIGLSILPIAALLTGTFFTIGIAVLLVVVLAIRKRRDPVSRNICDDKDKHLGMFLFWQLPPARINLIEQYFPWKSGMDMTVTAPLDMGTGQQRYVVAYTLKQGIEKQPDILNAQKSKFLWSTLRDEYNRLIFLWKFIDSESVQSFKDPQSLTTPPHRPDALYLSKPNYTTPVAYVSEINCGEIM